MNRPISFDDECKSCGIANGTELKTGGGVHLRGGWTANQYGGPEGFLGWLALQPCCHRDTLAELTPSEMGALGPNVQSLDRGLTEYWRMRFSNDPLVRVYLAYFNESPFDEPRPSERYHLHIHMIPRPNSFDELLREARDGRTIINAWKIASLVGRGKFPERYSRESGNFAARAEDLMEYLRHELETNKEPGPDPENFLFGTPDRYRF